MRLRGIQILPKVRKNQEVVGSTMHHRASTRVQAWYFLIRSSWVLEHTYVVSRLVDIFE